jgi:hypothetical protein
MSSKLVLQVSKVFECPWHGSERREEGGVDRWCNHPVSPIKDCNEANVPPPGNCPIRKAPIVVEVDVPVVPIDPA